MRKTFRTLEASGFLLSASSSGLAQTPAPAQAEVPPQVTVRVCNYAQIDEQAMSQAKKEATRIFQKARINLLWFDCLGEIHPACTRPLGPNDIVFKTGQKYRVSPGVYQDNVGGAAVRTLEGGGSGYATLFFDSVQDVADAERLPPGLILGVAMAHEFGHLLLPSRGHSCKGIMRAKLRRGDWKKAAQGRLFFTSKESDQMRAGVLARTTQEESAMVARLASAE